MNVNSPAAITFSFTGFAERGGRTSDHRDGWGIAFYEKSGCRVFRDDKPASDSPLAAYVRDTPIKSCTVLAHIRKATQGEVSVANCHPFQREWLGQTWVFAVNGDLHDFHPALDGSDPPVGSTDSERAFCWLMQRLRQRFSGALRAPSWQQLAPVLADGAETIARHGNFNFLLSNGQALYAHCSSQLYTLRRQHPFGTARLVDCDLSLDLGRFNGPTDRMTLIATEPLTAGEPWVALETGESRVFSGGETVWRHRSAATRAFALPDQRSSTTAPA